MDTQFKYVAIFNTKDNGFEASVSWKDLDLKGNKKVWNIWYKKDLGNFKNSFHTFINAHGCILLKISKS